MVQEFNQSQYVTYNIIFSIESNFPVKPKYEFLFLT